MLVQVNLVMSGHVHTYERFRGVSLAGKVQITRYPLAGIIQTYFSNSSTDGRTVHTPHPITILRDDSATANPNDRIPTTLTHTQCNDRAPVYITLGDGGTHDDLVRLTP